jgi:hypothetical protein
MTEPIQNPVENPIQSIVRWADDRVGRKGAVTIAAVAIVLALGSFVAVNATSNHSSSSLSVASSTSADHYGATPAEVIKALHICETPVPYGKDVSLCKFDDGGGVTIATSDDEMGQTFLVAMIKDQNAGTERQSVVVKGYVLTGNTSLSLTRAIGIPEAFAAKHHGYLLASS